MTKTYVTPKWLVKQREDPETFRYQMGQRAIFWAAMFAAIQIAQWAYLVQLGNVIVSLTVALVGIGCAMQMGKFGGQYWGARLMCNKQKDPLGAKPRR